jgi:hypothetical protein
MLGRPGVEEASAGTSRTAVVDQCSQLASEVVLLTNAQGNNAQFPPAQLLLDGTTWTRNNPYSQTSAVYQCPNHPTFHITLILKTPLNNTSCTHVHATPNQLTFQNLHLWYDGGSNFHDGAEHFKDLTKTQQNNAYNWYLANRGTIQTLLDTAYIRLTAAKTTVFPAAPAPAVIVHQAPPQQALAWNLAQQNAAASQKQHASAEEELNRKLRRVRKLLTYVSLTFPDAVLQSDKTFHFICDYRRWSAPLDSAVMVWAPSTDKPQQIPQSKFKALLVSCKPSDLFVLYGKLNDKGRVAWAVPRAACTEIALGDAGTDTEMQEIIRQKVKLDHVIANVITPEGYAPGHVFLPFVGGLIVQKGWYAFNPGHTDSKPLNVAIEFKLIANKLPRCVVQILPDSSSFCAFELLHFVHATELTKEQTTLFAETVPTDALSAWVKTLPTAEYDNGIVTIDGLQFPLADEKIQAGAEIAYKMFKMPAYFVRQKGQRAYFDMAGLVPLDPQGEVQKSGKKIQRARYDEDSQLLTWSDKSVFPLPAMVLNTLSQVADPESAAPAQCVRIITPSNNAGMVFYVLDLYEATPACTVLCMLGESYVLETSMGIRLATHLLQSCETCDDIMVMGDDGLMGWTHFTLTYPLKDYLKTSGLVITDCLKLTEVSSSGAKWWKVRVLEAECWVCTVNLQQIVSTTDDELQMLNWVIEAGGDGIVLITDGRGTWMARASSFSLDAPPVDTASSSSSTGS